ncbi:unnamed protein product [Sphenostylis stenocarpa]|uniref:Uncharacterized protein n=1 Tax=Sphenostylis stenocarpa TaxID=92480 RepID=A0AA86W3V7_9FABA|nr:unnamed protein product [Sphenostylis stenocarpa]
MHVKVLLLSHSHASSLSRHATIAQSRLPHHCDRSRLQPPPLSRHVEGRSMVCMLWPLAHRTRTSMITFTSLETQILCNGKCWIEGVPT